MTWSGSGNIKNATPRLLARITEEGLAGVTFTPAVQRLGSGTLAPHLLGRVGQMSPEEWTVYQEEGLRHGRAGGQRRGRGGL